MTRPISDIIKPYNPAREELEELWTGKKAFRRTPYTPKNNPMARPAFGKRPNSTKKG